MKRFLLGCGLATGVIVYWWLHLAHDVPFVPGFLIHDHVSSLLGSGDGQAVFTIATGNYLDGYRIARPLPIALAWIAGLGNPHWMPYGMLVVAVLGCGGLAYAVGEWIDDRAPGWGWVAPLVVSCPGVLSSLQWLGAEPLGLALALWGYRRNKTWALIGAGLFRETFLLFALAKRKASPIVTWGLWAGFSALVWPGFAHPGNLGFLSVGQVTAPTVAAPLFVATLALAAAAVRPGRWYVVLMLFLGPAVWFRWEDFTRILLPLWVLGFVGAVHLARSYVVRTRQRLDRDEDLSPAPALT